MDEILTQECYIWNRNANLPGVGPGLNELEMMKLLTAFGRERLVYNLTSSANSFAVTSEKLSVTSLIKTLKRTGPKTLPCGIPLTTGQDVEIQDPTRTDCVLLVRKA